MKRLPKKALRNTGGAVNPWGEDLVLARKLADCMNVNPEAKLPFTHGFHTYPARMHPETARRAIARFAPAGTKVLDPFMGSGTVAVEAVRAGLAFTGADISKVALEIAWARTRVWKPEKVRKVEKEGIALAEEAADYEQDRLVTPRWAEAVSEWFPEHTLAEIGLLRAMIERVKDEDLRRMFTCILSSIIVRLSRQASDSVTVPDRNFRPWPPLTSYAFFAEKCTELTRSMLLFSSDLHKRGIAFVEPDLRLADSRKLTLPHASYGLTLTSPPYPATYDYAFHHFLRYPLFNDDGTFVDENEIGSRREFKTRPDALALYRADMKAVISRCHNALAPGGRLLLLIGDGRFDDDIIHAEQLVRSIASSLGLAVPAGASQQRGEVTHDRRAPRRYEHLIAVDKPSPPKTQ